MSQSKSTIQMWFAEAKKGNHPHWSIIWLMANLLKRVSDNVAGDFFVDTTCINCDTCRQIAPATFAEAHDYAHVYHQPRDPTERRPCYSGNSIVSYRVDWQY